MHLSCVLHIPSAILSLSLELCLREIKKNQLHRNTVDRGFNTLGMAFTDWPWVTYALEILDT